MKQNQAKTKANQIQVQLASTIAGHFGIPKSNIQSRKLV